MLGIFKTAIAAGMVAVAVVPSCAHAQSIIQKGIVGPEAKTPMLMQADELVYDNKNNRVLATGNVEVYYNNYSLLSDRLIYDRARGTLTAEGNVRIKEPDGAIINANQITLTDDFKEGFLNSLKIVTHDEAYIASSRAVRKGGETTVFHKGVFTPCKPCADNPDKPPIWRVKARKVIHKKSKQTIYYRDATLDFFGVPIAWVPFFAHPDPSVKRKSGFLSPKYANSGDLGTMVETPYYFALSENYDFTARPTFTTKQGVLMRGDWRHRLQSGAYRISMAGIKQSDPIENTPSSADYRGSITTEGSFSLGSFWSLGWDATLESDDTFRRFYKLGSGTERVSKLFLVGQSERNYFSATAYELYKRESSERELTDARVHPVVDYNYIFAQPIMGGELSMDLNATSISRGKDDAVDSNRLSTALSWRRSIIDPIGQVFTPFASVRGDVYKMSDHADSATGLDVDDDPMIRGTAAIGLEYRYPFLSHTSWASHVIEPVVQLVSRPGGRRQTDIPNEDAQSLVFDDTLLFDVDKFSGYDRVETGTRANAGLRYTMQLNSGGYVRAVVGQSFHLDGKNSYADTNVIGRASGLDKDRSDYVTGLYFQPYTNLGVISQARFAESDFSLQRHDLNAFASYGPASVNVGYVFQNAQPELGISADREEINASGSLQIAQYWSAFGGTRYDIEGDWRARDWYGIKYADECFLMSVTYTEDFFRNTSSDIDPERTIRFSFGLKHLGGIDFTTDTIGEYLADDD
jgi:LPS-assembly protein